MERGVDQGSFDRWGSGDPVSPVIISVPHAGREYPPALLAALRVPVAALVGLEDRYVDAVACGARGVETMLVQRRGRAWIDLNRAEQERDPRVDEGACAGRPVPPSPRLRSGLGLVPRRVSGAGDLWRGRFTGAAIEERIAVDHRPYHAALQGLLRAARAKFGVAVLLDLHSMPPLAVGEPQVVIGDRFGRSAGARFVARLEAAVMAAGVSCGRNRPYAGGDITERHGRPSLRIHAIQIELDRSLYLDDRLDLPGPGLGATAALVRRLIDVLADEAGAGAGPIAIAAE
ncbi:N-formylglutamate amidohydrolase [Sphingomonas mollis]|uniref:N-formylglutamate amidohydrolase n=1 Tax=Sphingomonas mollis TaxID=2795726 RepID=A0ABS0XQ91_9SPHN|nr:N-formylglutamate amidohydrolase [Sphingomonas sp. BT553]MBJ6122206.1 N-formylglutamate amidohydrolase [Sphingomonas sp. BT553]